MRIRIFHRLQVRIIAGFLLLAYVPLGAVGLYAYLHAKRSYQAQLHRNLEGLAHQLRSRMADAIRSADEQLEAWTRQNEALQAPMLQSDGGGILTLLLNRFRQNLINQRDLQPIFETILCVRPAPGSTAAQIAVSTERTDDGKLLYPQFWTKDDPPALARGLRWDGGRTVLGVEDSPLRPSVRVLPIAREYRDGSGRPAAMVGLLSWPRLLSVLEETSIGSQRVRELARSGESYFLVVDGDGEVLGGALPERGVTPAHLREVVKASRVAGAESGPVHIEGLGEVYIGRSASPESWSVIAVQPARNALSWLRQVRDTTLAVAAGVLVLVLSLGLRLTRGITGPVQRLVRATQVVASGDLQGSIEIAARNEIGSLAESFNILLQQLRETVGTLQQSSDVLSTAVVTLEEQTAAQSQAATRQHVALQQTRVTAEEIKQTSRVASEKAAQVLSTAEHVEKVSQSGAMAVELSTVALEEIRTQVAEVSNRISALAEKARQIGDVTQAVKSLADRTQLLAMNASIEAVRSGEHGKGFQVVAKEMRSLAAGSIAATHQVREMLDDVGQAIREAVTMSSAGMQRIDAGIDQVKSSGERLRELAELMNESLAALRQIAATVGQQSAGVVHISSAVTDQTKLMEETVGRLEHAREAAEKVKQAASRMAELVRQFRI